MKLKLDFVTNSSSTVYLLYIPSNFEISDADLESAIQDDMDDYVDDFDSVDEFKEKIVEAFNKLKNEEALWRDGDSHYLVYYPLKYILTELHKEFVIFQEDVGPDSDKMRIIPLDKLKEIVAAEELKTMKGEIDVIT